MYEVSQEVIDQCNVFVSIVPMQQPLEQRGRNTLSDVGLIYKFVQHYFCSFFLGRKKLKSCLLNKWNWSSSLLNPKSPRHHRQMFSHRSLLKNPPKIKSLTKSKLKNKFSSLRIFRHRWLFKETPKMQMKCNNRFVLSRHMHELSHRRHASNPPL